MNTILIQSRHPCLGSGTPKIFWQVYCEHDCDGHTSQAEAGNKSASRKRVGGHTQLGLEGHSVGDRTDASCMSMASAGIAQPTFQTDNVHLAKTTLMRFTRGSSEVRMIQKRGKAKQMRPRWENQVRWRYTLHVNGFSYPSKERKKQPVISFQHQKSQNSATIHINESPENYFEIKYIKYHIIHTELQIHPTFNST